MGRPYLLLLIVLTVVSWAPLVLAVLASLIASVAGCALNAAMVHPCVVAGHDIGEALATMFLMGWAAVMAAPVMLGTLVGWFVVWTRRAPRG